MNSIKNTPASIIVIFCVQLFALCFFLSPCFGGESQESNTAQPSFLHLTLHEAVRYAVEGNSEIQISSLSPSMAYEDLIASEAIYDFSIFEENNIIRTNRPIQSLLDNGSTEDDTFNEKRWDVRAGVKKQLTTGGMFSLFFDVEHLDSSSEFIIPNPQYVSRLTAQVRQALLREFGDRSNQSAVEKANLAIAISKAHFHKVLAKVLRRVGISYWQLAFFQNQLDYRTKAYGAAEDIYEKEKVRNEEGFSSLLDVDRAFSAVKNRQREQMRTSTELKNSMNQLKLLLGISPDSKEYESDIVIEEDMSLQKMAIERNLIVEDALQKRPELIIAKKNHCCLIVLPK